VGVRDALTLLVALGLALAYCYGLTDALIWTQEGER
jgi:hypothetical protein